MGLKNINLRDKAIALATTPKYRTDTLAKLRAVSAVKLQLDRLTVL